MKKVAAKEDNNRSRSESAKLESLRQAIAEAREQYSKSLGKPFDQAAVDKVKSEGRRILAERIGND